MRRDGAKIHAPYCAGARLFVRDEAGVAGEKAVSGEVVRVRCKAWRPGVRSKTGVRRQLLRGYRCVYI